MQMPLAPHSTATAVHAHVKLHSPARRSRSFTGTLTHIVREKGAVALWSGTTASCYRAVPGVGIYLTLLSRTKAAVLKTDVHTARRTNMQPMQSLLIGSGCRAVVAMMFMPVLVVKTRIESGRFGTTYNPANLFKSLTQIAQYEGVRALWKGSLATILRDAPFSGLYYVFYQQTKGILETKQLDFDGVNDTGRQMNSNGCKLADTRRAQGGDVYSEAPVPCRIDDTVSAADGVGRNTTDKLQAGYCGQQDNQTQTKVQTQTQTQTQTQNQTQTDTTTQTPGPIQSRMPPTVLTSETAGSVPMHAYLQSDFLIRLLSGFIAGICATVVSHPPDIIRARLQASDKPHITTYSVVTQLLKEEGARGLLIGVWPRMIRRSLTAALSWTLFEQLVDLWEAQLSNKQSAQY